MNRTSILAGAMASVAFVATLAPQTASAINWNLDQGCGISVTCTGSGYGNTRAYTSSGVTLTASAWADTDGANDPRKLEAAHLERYSGNGLGVNNQDGCNSGNCSGKDVGDVLSDVPEHAIDNNERYDSVLFDFGAYDVKLTDVGFGWAWNNGDTDFTVLYSATGSLNGLKYGDLTSNGWTAFGSFNSSGTGTKTIGNANTFARYWLVLAYNSDLAACPLERSYQGQWQQKCDVGDDYFKLNLAIGEKRDRKVPEPGTLALLGLGLAGLGWTRRRR